MSEPERQGRSLHQRINRRAGADVQLFYGIGVPLVAAIGFIIAFAVSGSWWLLPAAVLALLALTAVFVIGFVQMLGQDEEDEEREQDPGPDHL